MRKHILLFLSLFFIYGCASVGHFSNEPVQVVLERIPDITKPDWTYSSRSYWTEDANIYGFGFNENSYDVKMSITEAENIARTKLMQRIKAMILSEVQKAVMMQNYDQTTANYVNSEFSDIMFRFRISGVSKKETYTEKVRETSKKENKVFYRTYVLLEISKKSYYKNMLSAIVSLKDAVSANKNAKKIVEKIEKSINSNK